MKSRQLRALKAKCGPRHHDDADIPPRRPQLSGPRTCRRHSRTQDSTAHIQQKERAEVGSWPGRLGARRRRGRRGPGRRSGPLETSFCTDSQQREKESQRPAASGGQANRRFKDFKPLTAKKATQCSPLSPLSLLSRRRRQLTNRHFAPSNG